MKEKTRKIFIMIVMAALIVSLTAASFAALTYGRYTGGKLDEDSPYEEIIDFVGATAFEVTSPDAFINAINNGYSYIKIADDAEEPFVINNNVADVYTNLVLDVNGHVVVRNSRNPLLDVRRSISVVLVYDSSTDADGGFYNPVGSSLQTSGGTLTVGEGIYESGPSDAADATLPSSNAVSLVTRENRTSTSYNAAQSGVSLPILTKSGGDKTKSGDKYLPENWTDTVSGDQINPDTYLLYTEVQNAFVGSGQTADGTIPDASAPADPDNPVVFQSGQLYINCDSSTIENNGTTTTTYSADIFSPVSNVASCDFYYYYPIDESGAYSSTAGTVDSPKTYAVVYGYNDVKGLAEDEDDNNDGIGEATALIDDGLVWPYAAIRSVEDGEVGGVTHARGGTFTTNFGTDNTYGIYSVGGTMTVGTDSKSTPPKFTATGEGTCIGMSAGENDTLTIENGEFSSKIGDTIKMSGGEMEVKKGSFTKDATGADENSTNNGSAISISGGTLNMAGSEKDGAKSVSFTVNGNYVNGIKMEKAENDTTANIADTIENAAFSFNNNGFGNSVAAIQVIGGTLNVSDSTFDFNGGSAETVSANNGIYVQGGSVEAENCTFTLSPNGSVTGSAAIASAGGTVTASGSTFTVNGFGNFGVHSSGGTVTATDCTFTMTQAGEPPDGRGDNFGIYSMLPEGATQGGTATAEGCTINITGTYSAGVLSMDGTLNLGASTTKETLITVSFEGNKLSSSGVSSEGGEINLTGNTTITSAGLGITARGEINVTGGTSTVKTERGTGIYVQNGTLTVEEGATVDVDSKIVDACSWVVPPEHTGDESLQTNKFNGVFVNGGSLVSEGTLNVTFTGVQNDAYGSGANSNLNANTAYRDFQIKSYAVRVEAAASGGDTKVSIAGGTISNSVGGGVYVGGGKVTLGVEKGNKGPTVQTTGTSVEDTICNPFNYGGNWEYQLPQTGGPAVKVAGGESTTIYGGEYRSQQGDGIVTTGGSATISQGTFYGNDSYDTKAGPGASYSFKVYGGTVTVKDGTFGSSDASGGGAFVAGTAQETAKAQINGGKFLSGGQAAFSILDNATVTFGEDDAANITVQGSKAGLVLEGYSGIGSPEITINGGNFSSTSIDDNESSAIWSGNPNFKLTINGGELTGEAKDGIFIARRTWNKESDPFIGTLKITGGEITGKTHGLNLDRDIKSENAVEISGNAVLTGSTGSGLNLAGALYKTHAVVITGGTFVGGQYGAYYGKDGGDDGVYINDGLLITGGSFTGPTSAGAGFFFGDNPWSQKVEGVWPFQTETPYNNVAIVGGTFSSFGANDDTITAGDVFTMHVEYNGVEQYGVDVGNGVYGNVGAGGGKAVMELNKITLTPTTNS